MKKSLIALAALAVTSAFAQSTVTISGQVTAAFERTGEAGTSTGLSSYDSNANNVTFKGTEDLGGGLKVSFELNKRFQLDTGAGIGGREFENSFITLSGGFGSISMGRHQPIGFGSYDVYGGLGFRAYQDYGYYNVSGARYDDAISYNTPTFNGFSAQFVTTFSPTVNKGREARAAALKYAAGPLSLQAAIEQVAVTTVGGAERNDKTFGASYDFGVAKAMLLWGKEGNADARTLVGVIVPVSSALNLKANYHTAGGLGSFLVKAGYAMGVDYKLSKRTSLFADIGDVKDSAQSFYRAGIKHTF